MSKEESSRGGLLSKVVRFVRNPTVPWSELDALENEHAGDYSKQALKELLERKRRNDFVRRREFAQLRQLRQRDAKQQQRSEEQATAPSFHGEPHSPGERAVTLQKIDEIEAQMSQQWWKTPDVRVGPVPDLPAQAPAMPASAGGAESAAQAFAPTEAMALSAVIGEDGEIGGSTGAAMHANAGSVAEPGLGQQQAQAGQIMRQGSEAQVPGGAGFPPEKFVHLPELEEAAIQFAQGDLAGAERSLLDILAQQRPDEPAQPHHAEVWMALFDLYRVTGQAERFESLAIDFAARFGRSAPLWFSWSGDRLLAGAAGATNAGAHRGFHWHAPSTLTVSALAALRNALPSAARPWTLVWSRVKAIDEEAVPVLTELFGCWAQDSTAQFVFEGVQALQSLLADKTPSGEKSQTGHWWLLRMALLRLMGRIDEFELVALDYCVTFEVSPPAWEAPRCSYADGEEADSAPSHDAPPTEDFFESTTGAFSLPAPLDPGPMASLSGEVEGDATPLLTPLEAQMQTGMPLVIDCEHLIRMDFAAAGTLLNWVAEQQSKGHQVQLDKLHRLVAILFNVIGVDEHAWVVVRKN